MTRYYAPEERARAVSRFAIAVPAANIVGGPLAAEGVPSIVLGVITLNVLPDAPATPASQTGPHVSLGLAFARPAILMLCAVYFSYAVGAYSVQFWVRLILKARSTWGATTLAIIGTIPSAVAVIAMVIVGARSDRTGERRGHVAAGLLVAAAGFVAAALTDDPYLTLIALRVTPGATGSAPPTTC